MSSPANSSERQGPGSVPGSSAWVAEQFTPKFYDVLHKHPNFLNRFYKDSSQLSVFLPDRPPMVATGEQSIQNVITQTVAHAQCSLQHVDSMYSIDRGVCIQVVGAMLLQGKEWQYVQTFFLATQENGFFVLNDMLRVFSAVKGPFTQPGASTMPPALAHPAMQEEVAPYVPNPKLLQQVQGNLNGPAPSINGPTQQQQPPSAHAPPPSASPAAAPAAATKGLKPEPAAAPGGSHHRPQQPASAADGQARGGQGPSPAPAAVQPHGQAAAPKPPPQIQVPPVPTPPSNMSMADRLKFIEQHKELHQKQVLAQQAAAAQQQAAAAATAQQQAAAAQQQQVAVQQAAAQQPQQAAEPQQIEPQREDRPSRATQQLQRQQRQQQQQQQQQEGSSQRPSANGHSASQGAPVHGVYVKNLPQGEELTEALLEQHFGQFGALKAWDGVPAVTIHTSPKHGKVAYIKFEHVSSVQAAKQSPPMIGNLRCDVQNMMPEYVNGPQPGLRAISASRGGIRGGGAPRRGGSRFGDGGRPPRSGAPGSGPADSQGGERQGSPSTHPSSSSGSKDQSGGSLSERPPRPAGSAPERSAGGGGGRGGGGGGRRSRSGSASRPKRDQGASSGAPPAPTPNYVPVASKT